MLVLLATNCTFGFDTTEAQADQQNIELKNAEDAVNQAFGAVIEAEEAGANVTTLLNLLNNAANLLAQAENANRAGDMQAVSEYSGTVISIAQIVSNSAQNAKVAALEEQQTSFWSIVALAIGGSVAFILVLFVAWRWFKGRYISRMYSAKPEISSQ